jgi:hypothetical protein
MEANLNCLYRHVIGEVINWYRKEKSHVTVKHDQA